ncbi:MAG: OmpA/MotB domain protein [Myxococcaceae bacterium]|nr:OmpA/MotB domain protein [Myxococcaceae bacterium]
MNHERWLVSYADFITLLFAFFVVLFAVSQVDAKKMGRFSEAVQDATHVGVFDARQGTSPILGGAGSGVPTASAPVMMPAAARSPQAGLLNGTATIATIRERLTRSLSSAIGGGRLTLVEHDDGLVVRLRDAAFFEPAKAQVRREVLSDLTAVGQTLRDLENSIRIEGHTDSVPIRNSSYHSNWELSAARAASVLDELVRTSQIHESRLSISGYASQRPLVSNDTPEGRSQNRRVDIVVLDRGRARAERAEPETDGAAP